MLLEFIYANFVSCPGSSCTICRDRNRVKNKRHSIDLSKKKVMNQTSGQADMYKEKEKEKERGDGEMQYCVQ